MLWLCGLFCLCRWLWCWRCQCWGFVWTRTIEYGKYRMINWKLEQEVSLMIHCRPALFFIPVDLMWGYTLRSSRVDLGMDWRMNLHGFSSLDSSCYFAMKDADLGFIVILLYAWSVWCWDPIPKEYFVEKDDDTALNLSINIGACVHSELSSSPAGIQLNWCIDRRLFCSNSACKRLLSWRKGIFLYRSFGQKWSCDKRLSGRCSVEICPVEWYNTRYRWATMGGHAFCWWKPLIWILMWWRILPM